MFYSKFIYTKGSPEKQNFQKSPETGVDKLGREYDKTKQKYKTVIQSLNKSIETELPKTNKAQALVALCKKHNIPLNTAKSIATFMRLNEETAKMNDHAQSSEQVEDLPPTSEILAQVLGMKFAGGSLKPGSVPKASETTLLSIAKLYQTARFVSRYPNFLLKIKSKVVKTAILSNPNITVVDFKHIWNNVKKDKDTARLVFDAISNRKGSEFAKLRDDIYDEVMELK